MENVKRTPSSVTEECTLMNEQDWRSGNVHEYCTKCGRSMNPICVGAGEIIDWMCTDCGHCKSNEAVTANKNIDAPTQ